MPTFLLRVFILCFYSTPTRRSSRSSDLPHVTARPLAAEALSPWPLHLNSFPPKQRHVFPEREEWLEKSPSCFAPPTHTAAAAAALLSAEPAKLPTRGEVSANSNRAHSRLRGPAGPGRPARAPAPLGFLRARCSWSALNEKVTAMSRLL